MFSIVVAVLLLCHILPISLYIVLTIENVNYKELSFGTTLSVTVNSSINFLIYCACGKAFRRRFSELIADAFSKVKGVCNVRDLNNVLTTTSSGNNISNSDN